MLEDTRELSVPSRRNSVCKGPGAREKSQGAVKKRMVWKWPRWCSEPSHPERGQTGKLFGSVYNQGCNTIPHVVLFTTLDCYLPILLTISSFLPSPSYDTLSLSLQDSSICHKLGIPFHESMVPTSLLGSQINLESLCVHLWITLKWNIVNLSFSSWHVQNVLPAWSTVWGYFLLDPPRPPKRGLVVKLLKHLAYTQGLASRNWAERQQDFY